MPIRRILLLTVSNIRGLKSYLSHSGEREGRNSEGAYLSSMKMARKIFWWFLFPGNNTIASSSKPRIRVILFQFDSTLVFATFFHPCLFYQNSAFGRVVGFLAMLKFFVPKSKGTKKFSFPVNPAIPWNLCSAGSLQQQIAFYWCSYVWFWSVLGKNHRRVNPFAIISYLDLIIYIDFLDGNLPKCSFSGPFF